MAESTHSSPPAPVIALASWLFPGAGYWLIGQRARAATVGLTIICLFLLGLLIGGVRVVEAPPNYLSSPFNAIMQKPWFLGQAFTGPIGLYIARLGAENARQWPISHARVNEIGTLYTAVAGMLNLLAIIDSAYRANRAGAST